MNVNQTHAGYQKADILVFTLTYDFCLGPQIFHGLHSASGAAASASGNTLEMQTIMLILHHNANSTPDQKLWERRPAVYGVTSPPGYTALKLEEYCLSPSRKSKRNRSNTIIANWASHTLTLNCWAGKENVPMDSTFIITNNHRND